MLASLQDRLLKWTLHWTSSEGSLEVPIGRKLSSPITNWLKLQRTHFTHFKRAILADRSFLAQLITLVITLNNLNGLKWRWVLYLLYIMNTCPSTEVSFRGPTLNIWNKEGGKQWTGPFLLWHHICGSQSSHPSIWHWHFWLFSTYLFTLAF